MAFANSAKEQKMEGKPIPFVVACKQFFGMKEGQGLREFQEEVKQLTAADRVEMAPLLSKLLGQPVSV